MKVAFLFPSFESLGIEALSASLKKAGHETKLFFDPRLFDDTIYHNAYLSNILDRRRAIVKEVAAWRPDMVALSIISDLHPWAMDMARRVKSVIDSPIVVGGIHPTSVPELVINNPNVDYLVRGEGDGAIVDLARAVETNEAISSIPNVWAKNGGGIISNELRPLIRDLDSLPFPDKTLYDNTFINGLGMYTIMASRGCIYKCAYCNAGLLKELYAREKGSHRRQRGVDNVIEELKFADRAGRVEIVIFYDEIFGADIRWLREFAPRYRREINRPFLISSHPAHATDEYVELLKEAGCIKVDLGVQSTDPVIRRDVLDRNETNEQIANAIDRFMKAGIFLYVENIFNLPGQNEENTIDMARFYNEHRPNGIKVFGLRIFPRTPIEKIVLDKGLISREEVDRIARGETDPKESAYSGGSFGDRGFSKFQTLLSIMPFLPPRWVDSIIDKRLYRFLPTNPRYGTILGRFLNSQRWRDDVNKRGYFMRYKYYLTQYVRSLTGRGSNG